jgi:hypothetical protein
VKFSGLIERVFAVDTRKILPRFTSSPLKVLFFCAITAVVTMARTIDRDIDLMCASILSNRKVQKFFSFAFL